ncbi:NEDD4-like protein [Mya arenaria]|uniref:E3 ubiquitin-protein ligase n=1 Tax=Mya arenaria TaxID=6604 RepID=A0ABY7DNF2_MYAAR|nr:NEDD4-like protein [Mya arenaria]
MDGEIHGLSDRPTDQTGTTKVLRIKVISGTNLAKKDIFGASDPYVRITLFRGDREAGCIDNVHTNTIKKSLNPKWEEEFLFRVNPRDNVLLFEVFDSNRVTRDDFLGLVEIPLNHTTISTEQTGREIVAKDYILRPRSIRSRVRGQLWIYLAYVPGENEDPSEENPSAPQEPGWEMLDGFSTLSMSEGASGSEASGGSASGPVQPEPSTLELPREPLPPGWEEKRDAAGRRFYVNHSKRVTQWERPTASSSTSSTIVTGHRERTSSSGNRGSGSSMIQAMGQAVSLAESSAPLLQGWEERVDANGRTYYVNHHTRHTQWERPTEGVEDTVSLGPDGHASPAGARRIEFAQQARGSPQTIDEDPLPAGWAMGTAPNGRVFYINHNNSTTTWVDPRKARSNSVRHSQDDNSLTDGWEERTHADGRVFYINHNTRKTQWDDPRLQKFGGPAVPYSRDFKRKYDYFRSKLRKPLMLLDSVFHVIRFQQNLPNKTDIKVTRKNVFEDSYRAVMGIKRPDLFKTRLWIEFDGEAGLDYGGVSREWFFLLSKEMFNPYYGLFEYSATDNYTLQINPLSGIFNEDHLSYFQFCGRIAGMADSEYYNSMCYIRDNDPESLDLLIVKWRFVSRIEAQMKSFMKGFNELIATSMLSIFDENEMELLMCGLQDIDVNDWKTHAAYKGEYNPNHPAIYSMNNETRARLLQFVTGTSRVPMNGFRELHGSNGPQLFTIEKWGQTDKLPRAHTCFNRLDLPPYESYKDLRKKLLIAIENAQGFEGVD